jgi:hypothetical protein
VSIYEVQKLLGHGNIRVTQVYSYFGENGLHEPVNKIDSKAIDKQSLLGDTRFFRFERSVHRGKKRDTRGQISQFSLFFISQNSLDGCGTGAKGLWTVHG